jgi:hypothetical protein
MKINSRNKHQKFNSSIVNSIGRLYEVIQIQLLIAKEYYCTYSESEIFSIKMIFD